MPPRVRLLHEWITQMSVLLPTTRVTQVRPLALFVLGMVWAGRVHLRAVAAALPLPVADASIDQRRRRWLTNERVCVDRLWRQVLPWLLASRGGQDLLLVLDPTPHNGAAAGGPCRWPGGCCPSKRPGPSPSLPRCRRCSPRSPPRCRPVVRSP